MIKFLFDAYKQIEDIITKFGEYELLIPVLCESINAQLDKGIQVKHFNFIKRNLPVVYDIENNKIYINYNFLDITMPIVKQMNIFNTEKKNMKSIIKNEYADILSGLLYYAIHSYNLHNRGILAQHTITLNWYKQFIYMLFYTYKDPKDQNVFVNRVTTSTARQVSELFYRPYIQIIQQYYEALAYKGLNFGEEDEKKLDFMFSQLKDQIRKKLLDSGLSQLEIEVYDKFFVSFLKDFKRCFRNNKTLVLKHDEKFMRIQEFECLNLRSLSSAYYHTAPYMPMMVDSDKGVKHKYPTTPFSELYTLATPIATTIGCGIYDYKKLKLVDDLQMLCARGIAVLT